MSERLNGHAQMDANAAESIAASQAAKQVTSEALAANAAFDRDQRDEANAMNAQFDKDAAIEGRRVSPEVRDMNEAADVEIFGSRGHTQGYVDADGQPLTSPIEGDVDKVRDAGRADEMRENRRYGTTPAERNAAADAYAARQGERDAEAEGTVSSIEELQAEGFELTQAKLVHDLAGEVGSKQQALFDKLVAQAAGGRQLSPEEDQKIRSEAVGRVLARTARDGDDVGMLKRIIKNEGLFNRDEYNKFRYKRGNEKNGERKEFTSYREQSIADFQNYNDTADHQDRVNEKKARDLLRKQMIDRKQAAEAERKDRDNEDQEPATEEQPRQEGGNGNGGPDDPGSENRWARFKRGVWKHLYEAPVKETPMGPAIQPEMPFDQWYAENRQNESRRQRRVIAAVGALAAAGVIAFGLAGGKENGQGQSSPDNVAHEHFKAGIGGAVKLPGTPEARTKIHLNPGDNPWTESEDILQARGNAHPTAAQIEELDKQMAKLNPDKYSYSGDSSEHMPVGTELRVPKP